jgi:hypothetical protein
MEDGGEARILKMEGHEGNLPLQTTELRLVTLKYI